MIQQVQNGKAKEIAFNSHRYDTDTPLSRMWINVFNWLIQEFSHY